MVAMAALAQTASEKPSVDVRRVGARLQCQCGCKDSVATCSMLECHFSKPAKERIAQMQAVFLATPNAWGWIVPYATAGFGLVIILLFLRKYYKPRVMTDLGEMDADDPQLAKYKEQIEKDTANLD